MTSRKPAKRDDVAERIYRRLIQRDTLGFGWFVRLREGYATRARVLAAIRKELTRG